MNYRLLNSIINNPNQDGTPGKFEQVFDAVIRQQQDPETFGGLFGTTRYINDLIKFFREKFDAEDKECDYMKKYLEIVGAKEPNFGNTKYNPDDLPDLDKE